MAEQPLPADMTTWMREVERRMAALERAPRLAASSMNDDEGNERIRFGNLDGGDNYGISVTDADGNTMFKVGADGMLAPYLPIHTHDADAGKLMTNATWTDTGWWMQAESISHEGLSVWMAGYTDAGTTGEIRILNTDTGLTTDAHVYDAAGGFEVLQFRWLHGSTVGTGPVQFRVQARRTSGAGNFYTYDPNGAGLTDPAICTSSGI